MVTHLYLLTAPANYTDPITGEDFGDLTDINNASLRRNPDF